jgi:hypothetical protein
MNQVCFVQHVFWLAEAYKHILVPSCVVNKMNTDFLSYLIFYFGDFSVPFYF